ncbi:MAG: hypothetical protein ACMXYF_01620 [Candidatus Woesearchaeota archaeon]
MHNLLTMGGTLKGNIGETIFTHLHKYVHRTKFDSYEWLHKMKFHIPNDMKLFLISNWGTIDAFEFIVVENKAVNLIFYEIKTTYDRNKEICITANAKRF